MLTELLAATTAIIGAATGVVVAAQKFRGAVAPLLRRRAFAVVVIHDLAHEGEAAAFAATLRSTGYRTVHRAVVGEEPRLVIPSLLGARAVVLWRPTTGNAADLLADVQAAATDATILIYTADRLPIPMGGDRHLIANSPLRLRGDLGVLAEVA